MAAGSELTGAEQRRLAEWINPIYFTAERQTLVRSKFARNSEVQLCEFLLGPKAQAILAALGDAGEGWRRVGPVGVRKFLAADQATDGLSEQLLAVRALVASEPFAKLLKQLTAVEPTGVQAQARLFRPRDYTVATHADATETRRLDATLAFLDDADELARALWRSEEVGGLDVYVEADDDQADEAVEVYDPSADSILVAVPPVGNALSLVLRDCGTLRFTKYLSASAPSRRADVAAVFEVADLGDGSDGSEDEPESESDED